MKSILKDKKAKSKLGVHFESAAQSSSLGAVRWTLPEEDVTQHSSAPTKSSFTSRPKDLNDLRRLQDCVRFLSQWREQVEQVCKGASKMANQREQSLEQCQKLILQWAKELKTVDIDTTDWQQKREEPQDQEDSEEAEMRIMEWAKELQSVTERCGLMRDEVAQMLRQVELKKKKVGRLLPFLEFITWSLLKADAGTVAQLWLATKQRTWKTETPHKYIPNSVWEWICSASVDITLDPQTSHPWLLLSDDHKKVQESLTPAEVSFSPQRFDIWPCVLGWEGLSSGRHYWEVDLANNGYWRLGLTTASAKRLGRFQMVPAEGYWALWRSTRQFYACSKPETALPLSLVPRKMGVYLDYDEGQVSFYNVENRAHIYTFKDNFKEKLYPLFAPLDGRTLISICSSTH
ncbi:E3 ubiquitin-protein ligase TRIM39-like [Hypomesus transpacificus]|uniref:E3 ubiquitin-protein ligase TRIM39-like n=1 Tax=Hypomesus transpacificus TaxID=137520 RepID=UPI001F073B9E|nr:E3 ubiquitin-protein ligase TRIM39-like [Hypomesus transpacificus]